MLGDDGKNGGSDDGHPALDAHGDSAGVVGEMRFVARGYSAPEIGEKLFISPKTGDTYKQRINEKLGIAHRSDYVDFALKIGLLTD